MAIASSPYHSTPEQIIGGSFEQVDGWATAGLDVSEESKIP